MQLAAPGKSRSAAEARERMELAAVNAESSLPSVAEVVLVMTFD